MKTLHGLMLDEMASRFSSEIQLVPGMQSMAEAATCIHLRKLVRLHMREMEGHVAKLGHVFRALGEVPVEGTCGVTAKLLNECERTASGLKDSPAVNAALICTAQKIKQHEIASYGCLREWSGLLGSKEAAGILDELLDEEKTANQALIKLARFRCNREALHECSADGSCDLYGHKIAETTV